MLTVRAGWSRRSTDELKVKRSVYCQIYVLLLTCDHKLPLKVSRRRLRDAVRVRCFR